MCVCGCRKEIQQLIWEVHGSTFTACHNRCSDAKSRLLQNSHFWNAQTPMHMKSCGDRVRTVTTSEGTGWVCRVERGVGTHKARCRADKLCLINGDNVRWNARWKLSRSRPSSAKRIREVQQHRLWDQTQQTWLTVERHRCSDSWHSPLFAIHASEQNNSQSS